jgi:hypothetical protein
MSSVLREAGRRKRKSRRLETVDVIDREDFDEMELDSRVELILNLIPLGLMHVGEALKVSCPT